ncbi:MAG TPA: ABC transporter substrate-binding protein [Candidatus Binatia bacterium]|jgi:putative ABC transport system substrate-binding protein|nr:ABC transporter substrate-binding protein [Candidatus Binatia bacterium]
MKKTGLSSILIAVALLAVAVIAEAQQAKKIPRVGFLIPGTPSSWSARIEAFQQGLRELGYVEGKNINIEYRYAEGKFDRVPDLAAEMVRLKVDVIVTGDTPAIQAVKKTTDTIPIVMGNVADPVAAGLVTSLARPGGNITGLTTFAPELDGKRLELAQEILPKGARVAFFWDPAVSAMRIRFNEVQGAARALEITLQSLEVRNPKELESAFEAAIRERPGALMLPNTIVIAYGRQIVDFAAKNRLPLIYDTREFIEDGGLMSYGPNFPDLWRRAATYVDKILKGAKPADLPVEQPTKFELMINLRTAKQIGLTIPPNVLARADRVIK